MIQIKQCCIIPSKNIPELINSKENERSEGVNDTYAIQSIHISIKFVIQTEIQFQTEFLSHFVVISFSGFTIIIFYLDAEK